MLNYPLFKIEKWPLSVKISTVILFNGVFLMGLWFAIFNNELKQLGKLQEFETFQKENYAKSVSHTNMSQQIRRQVSAIKNLYKHQVGQFCFATNQSLNDYFSQQAKIAKMKIGAIKIELMREQNEMFVQPVSVSVEGGVKQTAMFFHQLAQQKKIADLESLSLKKQNNQLLAHCKFVSIVNDNG